MSHERIIATIARMRDRDAVGRIMDAATARDCALANQESARNSKRVMSRYESLKKGDLVFIHNVPRTATFTLKEAFGKPLKVVSVHKRNKEIKVAYAESSPYRGLRYMHNLTLTWSVLDRYKVSTTPTPEALAYALKGGES